MLKLGSRSGAQRTAWIVVALVVAAGCGASGAAAAALPDGRAYELVSPQGKNGGDVMGNSQRVRASDDGGALAFSSLSAFGDAVGTGIATEYMSIRSDRANPGTSGWATHAITPPQNPLSITGVFADPLYVGDFSADLSRGIFRAWTPLTNVPNVAETVNLYRRDDLRTAGSGTYDLVTPCPLCDLGSPLPQLLDLPQVPVYAGASADFEHVVFEARVNLTSDAPAQPAGCASDVFSCRSRVYQWDAGQLLFAGLVPTAPATSCGGSNPPCVAAAVSIPGQGTATGFRSRPVNAISDDGTKLFFTVPTNSNGRTVTQGQGRGRLYMRVANTTTDELTVSERTDCAGDPSCGGDGIPDPAPQTFRPATYWGASVDGSRVFFTSIEALTDDAPGGDTGLYMYDTTKPPSDPHNLTYLNVDRETSGGDISNDVQYVIGESDDGRYVYFVTTGQLVPGEPLLGIDRGFYMWHEGDIAFIGKSVINELGDLPTTAQNWGIGPSQGRVTPDGRHLLLSSHDGSGLSIGYDHGGCVTSLGVGCRELYVYSADTKALTCASCEPRGEPATVEASSGIVANRNGATTWHLNRALNDDGSRVFFSTAEALVPDDVNGKSDVYQYDVPTHQLHLITSGKEPSDSYFMDASANGSDVFFITRERLLGWDVDASFDMYDARVGGGFPEPPPPAPRCSGSACQGAPSPPPSAAQIGSGAADGAGDLTEKLKPHRKAKAKQCKRGFVKRRVRGKRKCVKRRPHRSQHAAKRAGTRQQRRSK